MPSWIYNSPGPMCFSVSNNLLSTNNLTGTVLTPPFAQTDLTFPTTCEVEKIIIPLSKVLKLRLKTCQGHPAGSMTEQGPNPVSLKSNHVLKDAPSHLPCIFKESISLPSPSPSLFPLLVKHARTLPTKSHVYKSIAISCISLLMLKDS